MKTSENSEVYSTCIIDFLHAELIKNVDKPILVFKGFPLGFYSSLIKSGISHLSSQWIGSYPSKENLDEKQILNYFLLSTTICWAFYEEFIILTNTLNSLEMFENRIIIVDNNIFDEYYPLPIEGNNDSDSIIKVLEDENPASELNWVRRIYSDYKIENDIVFLSYINRHYDIDTGIHIPVFNFFEPCKKHFEDSPITESIEASSLPYLCYLLQDGQLNNKQYIMNSDDSVSIREKIGALNSLGYFHNVSFSIIPLRTRARYSENAHIGILKRYWGENAQFKTRKFYENPSTTTKVIDISQGSIVSDVILQCENILQSKSAKYSDIIVTAPTGAGKSLFFQIPSIHLHNEYSAITIVISPLVALMIDQVNELEERGVRIGTYINSSITFEERQIRIERIKGGEYSLIYLAPELLLSYDLRSLIGDRTIGLFVIDEAHLVTTWGRDFRVDYWFLGDHIEKIRKGNHRNRIDAKPFPILCLTATAVFGGNEDIVGDLQNSLHLTCYADHLYIGYVRRDNIIFDIRHPEKKHHSDKEEKVRLTAEAIHQYITDQKKTIIYFPYKSQIEDVLLYIKSSIYADDEEKIEKYYSGIMSSIAKNGAYIKFRGNESLVMLATKAFGMGVNIPDIENVYHYAPTGSLSDYVQEVGRAARQLPQGNAITDYLYSDMNYARTLWGLSGLRQYQLHAIMKKLYSLYDENKKRNLLFTPESFGFLFDDSEVDTKVKSGLMLLSSDLQEKFHFNVLSIRPKNLFTKQYIIVPFRIENEFLADYGKYCIKMKDNFPTHMREYGRSGKAESTIISKTGNVFEIDLYKLWETKFENSTFAKFKHDFFFGDLFSYQLNIVPNVRLAINYKQGYDQVKERFSILAKALQDTFNDLKRVHGGKNFQFSSFNEIFIRYYNAKLRKEYSQMLLDLFCYNSVDVTYNPTDEWKFVVRKKPSEESAMAETEYAIKGNKVSYIASTLSRYLSTAEPNLDYSTYVVYLGLPQNSDGQSIQQLLASMLQLFDLASYEISG